MKKPWMTSCDAIISRTGRPTREVQLVDLALAAGMLHFPHPLLGDDDRSAARLAGAVDPKEQLCAPGEQSEKGDQRTPGPADLPMPAFLDRGGRDRRCCRRDSGSQKASSRKNSSASTRMLVSSNPTNRRSTLPGWVDGPDVQSGIHCRHISDSARRGSSGAFDRRWPISAFSSLADRARWRVARSAMRTIPVAITQP